MCVCVLPLSGMINFLLVCVFLSYRKKKKLTKQKLKIVNYTCTTRPGLHHQQRGIPPHYGLSYSMGFGLIVEGILSSCYHLCPTRMSYQFGIITFKNIRQQKTGVVRLFLVKIMMR